MQRELQETKALIGTYSTPGRARFYSEMHDLIQRNDIDSLVLINVEIENLDFVFRLFGPQARDEVIENVASIISRTSQQNALLYHIAQFRFALVLRNSDSRQASQLTEMLICYLRDPLPIGGSQFNVDVRIGISHFPEHGESVCELVRTSAMATHIARLDQTTVATFDKARDDWDKYQFKLLTDLKRALKEKDQISLAFQPIVHLKSGTCTKFEALCRWQHPELGNVPPSHFFDYVERSPLIVPLTECTLSLSLHFLRLLQLSGFDGMVAINLSTSLLRLPDLGARFKTIFESHNVHPRYVCFEVTETGVMEHRMRAAVILGQLRELGSKIAIDDFGTGHSSLAYLSDLPIDIIKIDRCFISGIAHNRSQAIVAAAATVANELGMETVAEGIENEAQYVRCAELGVTYGQGYFKGRPMQQREFLKWYAQNKS